MSRAPAHAVRLWIVGNNDLHVEYENDVGLVHESTIPVHAVNVLIDVLRNRARADRRKMTVGTPAAPVQYDIDQIAQALVPRDSRADGAARRAKEHAAARKRGEKRDRVKAADKLLATVGLL